MYIVLAACLVAIAAYYPIKLIKFYCMESREQSTKNQIISDLRAGTINRHLIKVVLGEGGYRLMRREIDHIFEWMLMNTNEWRVAVTSKDELVVVFRTSPFHPGNWDDVETYKNVMRQMFGEHGTKDFRVCRASMTEANKIWQNLRALKKTEEEPTRVNVYEYVRMMFGGEKVLAMVTYVNDNNGKLVVILSGTRKGLKYWATSNEAMEVIPDDVAISELVRLKEEWKNEKREETLAKRREEFREKYGNIVRGSYLKKGDALYLVESVNIDEAKATAIRLIDLGTNFRAGGKCILPLENSFTLVTAEDAAEILLKEYSNE